ncbi:MAG: Cof-type HAD-IIB family hydrolase [Brevinemataceae bacterium]
MKNPKFIDNADVMKNFNPDKIRAVAIDIDGTLLNDQLQCSEKTISAIKKLINTGREVYIVTGRGTSTALPFAKICGIPNYMINFNGASIWNMTTNSSVFESYINTKEAIDILRIIRQNNVLAIVYSQHEFFYELENEFMTQYLQKIKVQGFKKSLEELPLDSFLKILIIDQDPQKIKTIHEEIQQLHKDNLYTVITSPGLHDSPESTNPSLYIEIMNKNVNKGKSLEYLLSKHHISMADTVAFGDDTNDIEMLSSVGWGIAMKNARPSVKEAAPLETLSNNDDGVAYFIEKYLL